jgi:hypothetical protein
MQGYVVMNNIFIYEIMTFLASVSRIGALLKWIPPPPTAG